MPVNVEDIMELLNSLAREEKLRVTIKECVKGAAIVGTAAAVGGFLAGPPGMAIAGCVASCATAASSHNKYQSVVQILADMEPYRREELAENVRRIINNVNATDMVVFAAMVGSNTTVRNQVLNELFNYMTTEMNLAVERGF